MFGINVFLFLSSSGLSHLIRTILREIVGVEPDKIQARFGDFKEIVEFARARYDKRRRSLLQTVRRLRI